MKHIALVTIIFFLSVKGDAQQIDKNLFSKISANQKTANSKDVLTNFFRASVDNLLGDKHSFALNTSLFALDSIFRKNGTNSNGRTLRQVLINFDVTADSSNSIQKIGGGLTLTLINKPDIKWKELESVSQEILKTNQMLLRNIKHEVFNYIGNVHPDVDLKEVEASWNLAAKNHTFKNLHPFLKEALEHFSKSSNDELKEASNDLLEGKDFFQEAYKKVALNYAHKPLLTLTPLVIFNRISNQADFTIASAFTVGISRLLEKPWELEIRSQLKIAADSTVKEKNHNNKPFSFSLGVNKVLLKNKNNESTMEFKLFSQLDKQLGVISNKTDQNKFTFNSTLRVSPFKSFWIPFTLSYDPEKANLFGYFSLTANLDR